MNKKIAIPTLNGAICAHFGHCEKFAIFEVEDNKIVKEDYLTPPPHEPGSHPAFLRQHGCTTIIAGGMGSRAQTLFAQNNIDVVIGLNSNNLQEIVNQYIAGNLQSGNNFCDH